MNIMSNYAKMTTYELEKLRDEYLDEIGSGVNEYRVRDLSDELDLIEDELDSRDPLADE